MIALVPRLAPAAAILLAGPAVARAAEAGAAAAVPGPTPWILAVAAAIVGMGAVLVLLRVDVRLVLLLCATPLYLIAGRFPEMLAVVVREMSNLRTVIPICSAVGFAHVLTLTGCDKHLVHLLLKPLRRARLLLIPGGVAAGYLVNTAVVSQAGSAAVVGPILIPLLRAGGVGPTTAGALLLLGCSMGGELFNPGAVEVVTMARLTGLTPREVIGRTARPNLLGGATALLAFWALAARRERRRREAEAPSDGPGPVPVDPAGAVEVERFRVNPIRAAVPLLPLILLFAAPSLMTPPIPAGLPEAEAKVAQEQAGATSILVAMLIGSAAAGLTAPGRLGRLSSAFCDGAGFGYAHVISLIVTATTFAESIKACGLIDALTSGLAGLPAEAEAGLLVGMALPWGLATITGSGIAPAVAVMQALLPTAADLGLDPARLGTAISLAAHYGRTMSPVAAVVMMSARLSESDPVDLVRRTGPPLLAGGVVLFLAIWFRLA